MNELMQHYSAGCGLEILKGSLFVSPSSAKDVSQEEDLALEGRELKDVCSLSEDDGTVDASDVSKLSAECCFHPHMRGEVSSDTQYAGVPKTKEILERSKRNSGFRSQVSHGDSFSRARLNDKSKDLPSLTESEMQRRPRREHCFSTDIDRDEAWERKRDLYHSIDELGNRRRIIGRSVSDCTDRGTVEKPRLRTNIRSLTDEDLEELRGCIDLGFGFSDDESSCDLKSTFPALELYYAINRNYADIKSRCSPDSPLDRTYTVGSPHSPLSDSWRISSPGDHPSRVKVRLRHWAQAVACSIKQGFTL